MTTSNFTLGGFAGSYDAANTGILSKTSTDELSVGLANTSLLATGTANANTFLCGDGTWKVVVSGTNNPPIITNSNTINTSYSFPPGINGISVGPMSMANGVSVTIPPAQRWIIL